VASRPQALCAFPCGAGSGGVAMVGSVSGVGVFGGERAREVDEIGFAPMDDTGRPAVLPDARGSYERRSLGIASHWPFEDWGRFLPEHTTAVSRLDRLLYHRVVVATDGESSA
jgi:hypothetical protein